MIDQRIRLRCGAVQADMHAYLAAAALRLITTDLLPAGILVKHRLVSIPGRSRAFCEIVSMEDGRLGTEMNFHLLFGGAARDRRMSDLVAAIRERAQRAGQLARPIGFQLGEGSP